MCCSLEESNMSSTKLYVGEARKNGKLVHVLAYQNKAQSKGPNAMVIPFPTNEMMSHINVIDTSDFKSFLDEITESSRLITKSFDRRSLSLGSDSLYEAQVFEVGSYTVLLAQHASQIEDALGKVSKDKRPKVSLNFLKGYAALYPNMPIAICCWSGQVEAEPLLWWYEPRDGTRLFIPTMDAHNGEAPVLGSTVETDHIISVGSVNNIDGHEVKYTDKIPDSVKELLPSQVWGKHLPYRMENADCYVDIVALRNKQVPDLTRGLDYSHPMSGWT